MENQQSNEFVPRSSLRRVLAPDKHATFTAKYFLICGILLAVFSIYFMVESYLSNKPDEITDYALFLAVAVLGIIASYFNKQVSKTVEVKGEGLAITVGKKTTEFKYSEITSVTFTQNRWLGSHFTIHLADSKKFTIATHLERNDYILDTIYAHNPKTMSLDEMLKYRQIAISASHISDIRREVIFSRRSMAEPVIIPFLVITVIAIVRLSMGQPLSKFKPASYLVVFVIAAALEIWTSRALLQRSLRQISENILERIKKDPNSVRRDLASEQKILTANKKIHYSIMASLTLAFLAYILLR